MDHLSEYAAAKELAEEVWPDFQRKRIGVVRLIVLAHKRGHCANVGIDAMAYLRKWKKEDRGIGIQVPRPVEADQPEPETRAMAAVANGSTKEF